MRPETDPFLARLREAFLAPRRSMRRGLEENWGSQERWLMVAAGGLINALVFRILLASSPEALAVLAQIGMGGFYLSLALATLMQYALVAGLINLAGRFTGGAATPEQGRSVAAWWTLVSALLTPLSLIPVPLVAMFAFVANFALLAAYVAEAQKYRSLAATMAAVASAALLLGMLMLSLLQAAPA